MVLRQRDRRLTRVHESSDRAAGSVLEVFLAFLKLGLTSFGGPVAHLSYFRDDLIQRRRWMDEEAYADLVALCQFLPGPASSQVAFALGLIRARSFLGGLAASFAFTTPSAILLFCLAFGISHSQGPLGEHLLHGLRLVAVAVVAQAVYGMAKSLTPDRPRVAIALFAIAVTTFFGSGMAQILTIAAGAGLGLILCRGETVRQGVPLATPVTRRGGLAAFAIFGIILIALPVLASMFQAAALFAAFFRSGAFVFGGGHVVLPLLQTEVVTPGWLSADSFLTGYGLAQAVPGPLFTLATYLGALVEPRPNGWAGASLATIAIFLPGLLLVYGMLPFWAEVRNRPSAQAAMAGTNAAVVGLLGAALYDPVWVSAVASPYDFLLAQGGFLLVVVWRLPPLAIVILVPVLSLLRP